MSMKQVQRTLAVEDDFDESKPSRRWPATMRSTKGGVSVARIWPINQGVSAKGFGRAIKRSRRKDLAEQSRSLGGKDLAEQSRSLGGKQFCRAIKKTRRKDLSEQPSSLGVKEVGRAIKESSDHEKSLRTMKRVFGP